MLYPGRQRTLAPLGLLQIVCGLLLAVVLDRTAVTSVGGIVLTVSGGATLALAYLSMKKGQR
ncbi:hypothetical protein [Streptomyces genisteinicus]|uniref:Uncharacterized protein n=1 Tax=Streptomyces genisteinicus TaxID=2768068 RepID=A0A7H0HZ90_9ACTN|nr:hypothetical protein [Streptomyces genisteinicus]QNP65856.1 hypothetical protein IAG43_24965 [Streptomyces genisteinicus]